MPATVQPSQILDHLVAAQAMCSYWSIGIFLYATLFLASGVDLTSPITDRIDPRQFCRAIASIIPTFLHPDVGGYGIHGPIFPSIVALSYLEEVDGNLDSDEARTFYRIFQQSEKGRHVQNFVENMRTQLGVQGVKFFAPIV